MWHRYAQTVISTFISMSVQGNHEILKMGWLQRRYPLGFSTKRYCRLIDGTLWITKDEKEQNLELSIKVQPTTKVQIIKKLRFLVSDGKLSATLEAETIEDLMNWVQQLRICCFTPNGMSMDDFNVLSVIGVGFYGKVMLCQSKTQKTLYAIKAIRKAKLLEYKQMSSIINERNILMQIQNPFIVQIKFAFQNHAKFYLGLEYVPGGELFYHLKKFGAMSCDQVRLYVMEIGLALNYLHCKGIIYRDLKPENVMLDADGHIKLTDFGLAKVEQDCHDIEGTEEYLPPEAINHQRCSFAGDWWQLGVLTYELLTRKYPFRGKTEEIIRRNILEKEPVLPATVDSKAADLVRSLLVKNPAERMGYPAFVQHPFFESVSFDDVLSKKIRPAFVPVIKEYADNVSFDVKSAEACDSYALPILSLDSLPSSFTFEETVIPLDISVM